MKQILVAVICLTLAGVSLAAPPDESSTAKNKKAQQGQAAHPANQAQPVVKGGRPHAPPMRTFSPAPTQTVNAGVHRKSYTQTNVVDPQTNVVSSRPRHLQAGQKFHTRQFSVATAPKAGIPSETFHADRHVRGSEAWHGKHYQAFRNYRPQWHDRHWWRHHHHRIVFIYGGWYFWNADWWYPAWGYDPNAYYPYDGPIYAYNDLPPDQVIANVQGALQEQGYYDGEIDGILGPLTRAALARYQQDHGLYITSAIDPPTLQSLGMS